MEEKTLRKVVEGSRLTKLKTDAFQAFQDSVDMARVFTHELIS
jgi:hypothetical protein